MNRTPDVELVLRDYFADDGLTAPDYLLNVVERRISRQPRQRAWRQPRRLHPMNRTLTYAATLAAVLVIAVVGYNLLPRIGPGGPGPSPSSTPTVSPTSSSSATAEPIACEDDLAGCAGTLVPGRHVSNQLQPALAYETTGEWLNVVDLTTVYKIDLPDPNDPYLIVWTKPLIAEMTPLPDCGVKRTPGAGTSVDDWIAMLRAHPALVTTSPVPIDLGGASGQSIEVTVAPGWQGCTRDGGYVVQFILDEDPVRSFPYGVDSTQRMLLDIVDVAGQTVIVQVYGPVDRTEFLTVTARTRALIDTFRFTPAN